MLLAFLAIAFITLRYGNCDGGSNWGFQTGKTFNAPDTWKNLPGTMCGGTRQSPVAIVKSSAVYSGSLQPLKLGASPQLGSVVLKTTATFLSLSFNNLSTFTFNGVGCFRPVSIHWHWGSVDKQGSEHTLDGFQYSMEGHIVTYNCLLYSDSTNATISPSGLYAFGVLYKIGEANLAIDKFLPYINTVISNGNTTIPEISPYEFLPKNLGSYYRYEGSLTTPPCTENVIWTVFTEIQTISSNCKVSIITVWTSSGWTYGGQFSTDHSSISFQ